MKNKTLMKTLSVLLAVVMVICSAPLSGFVGLKFPEIKLPEWNLFDFGVEAEAASASISTNVDKTFLMLGDIVIVTVDLDSSLDLSGVDFVLSYDSEQLEYIDSSVGMAGEAFLLSGVNHVDSTVRGAFVNSDASIITTMGTLARITFKVVSKSAESLTISLSATGTDSDANFVSVSTSGATLIIGCSGTCGNDLTWDLNLENGILNIAGTGAMFDYDCVDFTDSAPWYKYRSSIKKVNILEGVTDIGNGAFFYCTNLVSITIPDSVATIGFGAFDGCTGLKDVYFEGSITDWVSIVFYNYDGVYWDSNPLEYAENFYVNNILQTNIIIPDAVTKISAYAFCGFDNLISVEIPNSVTYIGEKAFAGSNISEIIIPDGVIEIGDCAFDNCFSLEKVVLPKSLAILGVHAFANCDKLSEVIINCEGLDVCFGAPFCGSGSAIDGMSVVFSDSVLMIPDNIFNFWSCSGDCAGGTPINLKSVTIGENVVYVDEYAFCNNSNLKELNFNAINCTFANSVFSSCSSLTDVNIGDSVEKIPEYFISDCKGVTNFNIPESVRSIGNNAFSGCSSIIELTIPVSVSDIEYCAFSNCENLENVVFLGKDGIYIGDNIFDYSPKATICCKENSYMHYYADINAIRYCIIDEANNPTYEIKNEVLIIYTGYAESLYLNFASRVGYGAFGGNTLLKQIELSSCIDRIYDRAFTECENLETIIIPKSVISIGGNAFYGCDKLTIYCYAGSYAETYAKEHDIKYDYITLDLTESNVKLYSDEVLNLGTAYNIDIVDSEEVLWISDNESVVKVAQNGKITAIGEGTATITAKTESGLEAECTVTVNAGKRPAVEGVTVSDFTVSYKVTTKIEPDVKFAGNVDYIVEYSSSNESVVTVDKDDNVIATGTGEAEITVTVTDEYGNVVEDTCKVTVSYAWWQWLIIIFLFGWIWY